MMRRRKRLLFERLESRRLLSEIRGFKWDDQDGDSIFDGNEPGLFGRTIFLDQNRNRVLDAGEATAVTAADGSYAFTNLGPGTYYLAETAQSLWRPTYPKNLLEAQTKIFVNGGFDIFGNNGMITRLDVDGSNATTIQTGITGTFGLDDINSDLYFWQNNVSKRSELDGTGSVNTGLPFAKAYDFDVRNSRMFYSQERESFSTNFAYSPSTRLHLGLNFIQDLEYDPVSDRIFVANRTGLTSGHNIYSAPADGSAGNSGGLSPQIVGGITDLGGVAFDAVNRKLYFTDSNTIYVSNFDGTQKQLLTSFGRSYVDTDDIEVVPELNALFWTDSGNGRIYRSTLDGTDVRIVSMPGFKPQQIELQVPWYSVVLGAGETVTNKNFGNRLVQFDFGDAPSAAQSGLAYDYDTDRAVNGPRHANFGPKLGLQRDTELDGQPTALSDGDDANGSPDDEDGIQIASTLYASTFNDITYSLQVNLQNADPVSNKLNAWIDFDRSGFWDETTETIFDNYELGTTNGVRTLLFTVPRDVGNNVQLGSSVARFRLSTAGSPLPINAASDGEIEDYVVNLAATSEIQGTKWRDRNNDGIRTADEPGLPEWEVYMDINNNGQWEASEPKTLTQQDNPATTHVNEAGFYRFVGVSPGTYVIREIAQAYWRQSFPGPVNENKHTLTIGANQLFVGYDFGGALTPQLAFVRDSSTAVEPTTEHRVAVQLQMPLGILLLDPISVQVVANPAGSASIGSDFQFTTQTLTFGPLSQQASIRVANASILQDLLVEGLETIPLTLVNPSGLATIGSIGSHLITIIDDDSPRVLSSAPDGIEVTEFGRSVSVGLRLSTQPTGNVVVSIASNDSTEGTVSVPNLTFTTSNWNQPQSVFIAGVDDIIIDGNVMFSIRTSTASNSDPAYAGLAPFDWLVTNLDDDQPGVLITSTTGNSVTESGGQGNFTVVLKSPPSGTVNIGLTSNDSTEGTVAPSSVTFDLLNWNVPQFVTVTGVNDEVDDDNISFLIVTSAAISSDLHYNGLNPSDVSVLNLDDDVAGILLNRTAGLITTEAGGTDNFTIVLNSQPTSNVTINLLSNDNTEGTVNPTSITFTPENWNVPIQLVASGFDDQIDDGDIAYGIMTFAASSMDAKYFGMNPPDVSVTNLDNDTAGITVSPVSGLTTTENGGTAGFSVVLQSQPLANVTIDVSSSDTTEGSVSPTTLTFTQANWNVAQNLMVRGVDDLIDDNDIAYTIVTAPAVSTDAIYQGMNAADVSVVNLDSEFPGAAATHTGGTTLVTEGGPTDNYTVVLTGPPNANVVITIIAGNQLTTLPTSLTFTPINWNVPQSVEVRAIDDSIFEGTHSDVVAHTSASLDSTYNGLTINNLTATITDNDVRTLSVSVDPSTISEFGGVATGVVTRNTASNPQSLTVRLSNGGSDEVTLPATVTIPANSASVSFQITAVDDAILDGTQTVAISAMGLDASVTLGLDTSYAINGYSLLSGYRLDIDPNYIKFAVQADGKPVIAGRHATQSGSWNIYRLNVNGSLDSTFGLAGVSTVAFPGLSFPQSVDVYPDGKILVVGRTTGSGDHLVARLTPTGAIDLQLNSSTSVFGLDAIADKTGNGGFYVAGSVIDDFGVVRYNSNGTRDTNYGTNGIARLVSATSSDAGIAAFQQADGKILVAGTSSSNFGIVRFNTHGTPDTTFSGDGLQTVDLGSGDSANDVVVQPDGRIVLVGTTNNRGDWAVVRLNADGTLDTNFSGDGKDILVLSVNAEEATSVAIQQDGKIVVAGDVFVSGEGTNFAFVRYQSNGALDPSFDLDGKLFLPPQPSIFESIYSIQMLPNGKALALGGYTSTYHMLQLSLASSAFIDGTTTLQVTDYETVEINVVPNELIEGGLAGVGTVTRSNTDMSQPLTVSLSSSNPSAATVPVTVEIPANQASATFLVTPASNGIDSTPQNTTLAGTATGYVSGTRTVTVHDSVRNVFDLSTLSGVGTVIRGAESGDRSGYSISHVGDVNRDGYDDIVVGAPSAAGFTNLKLFAGESYLLFGGPALPALLDLANLGAAGIRIFGADQNDQSGYVVSGGGDVNGDGFHDILIGAFHADRATNPNPNANDAYVIFGASVFSSDIDLSAMGTAGVTIRGATNANRSGSLIGTAGDINSDGFADIIVGAPLMGSIANTLDERGRSYVIYGRSNLPSVVTLDSLGSNGITIQGAEPGDRSGSAISAAGDVNGDGFGDLLIGADSSRGFGNNAPGAGETYLIFGGAALPTTVNLAALGSMGSILFGSESGDRSGQSVQTVGDFNGDGFADLVIGASTGDGFNNQVPNAGEAYLIYGSSSFPTTLNLSALGTRGVRFDGVDTRDLTGIAVTGLGDVDGDGLDDLAIGSHNADALGNAKPDSGETYVLFGGTSLTSTVNLGSLIGLGVSVYGANTGDESGFALSRAGDVNGDGFNDMLIGAPMASGVANNRPGAGESYLVFGRNAIRLSVAILGSTQSETLTGTTAAQSINGSAGNDILVGNGGGDVLLGSQGDDVLAISDAAFKRVMGGTGIDTLRLDGSGWNLDLTSLSDQRLNEIEVIDITGIGNNTLTLNAREVLSLSSNSNTLIVRRNPGDVVNLGPGWTIGQNELISGQWFQTYTQGQASLKVRSINDPPVLSVTQSNVTGNVLSTLSNTGTWNDPESGNVDLTASIGTVTKNGDGTWAWQLTPATSLTNVTVTITANDGVNTTAVSFVLNALVNVTNRAIYYKGSSFAAGGVNIARALAPNKILAESGATPLTLSFANVSNYTRGINGIVFDIAGLASTNLTVADFGFRMSPTGLFDATANPPSSWLAAPPPSAIVVSPGNATTAARVRIEWADNAIINRWLQIRIAANGNTGLSVPKTYYIGHLYGEVNGVITNSSYVVNSADLSAVLPALGTAPLSSSRDVDKNGVMQNADLVAVRNATKSGFVLRNITISE
ncbi:MAG: SdrD B-like domain-containing protein [Pirellula sp.]